MSYKYVLHGDLSSYNKFNCRTEDGPIEELRERFLPDKFLSHSLLNGMSSIPLCYYIQVYNENSIGISFYLRDDTYYDEDIRRNLDTCLAQVQFHIDFNNEDPEDDEIIIKWISVKSEYRGKGYAKLLLSLALIHSHIIGPSVTYTKLDDDSDAYANGIEDATERRKKQSKNLYCRMGYKYEDPTGGPEMIGDVKTIISQIEGDLKKRKRGSTKRKKRNTKKKKKATKRRLQKYR